MKLVPVSVTVSAGEPAVAEVGSMEPRVGAGFEFDELPDPPLAPELPEPPLELVPPHPAIKKDRKSALIANNSDP